MPRPHIHHGLSYAAALIGCAIVCQTALSDEAIDRGFEGAETSWRFEESTTPYRVEAHRRTSENPHSGSGCEVIRLSAGNGRSIDLALDIPPARVIAEFRPSLWVRGTRPGVQLFARVVFPRTADEKGKPLVRLLAGAQYQQAGAWQQLRFDQLPRLVEQAARPMRAQYGSHIDVHEAYVDRLVLNVYTGPGMSQVAIDDLNLPHLVSAAETARPAAEPVAAVAGARRRVELVGSVLLVDGHPFFPRMIDYQGESLTFLKQLGFNVVRLATAPPDVFLAEARRAGLWLVCPPPPLLKDEKAEPAPFDNRYDCVLAWYLGQGLTARELDAMRGWVDRIRRADEDANRPLICDPADEIAQYARLLGSEGVLALRRYVLGTTFELSDYTTWLRMKPRLGVPGTPVWATIETQYSQEHCDQISLLSASRAPEPAANFEQIRLLTQAALTAGVRGLWFTSRSPLDAQDPVTRLRATILALVNLELDLIHDWVAAGTITSGIRAANVAGKNPGITGATLQASRSRLLLPLWAGTGAQYVPDQLAGNAITFVVAGAPEDHSVYELTAGGLRSLDSKRLVGGVHVKQNEFGVTSMIMLTDQVAIGATTRRLWSAGSRAAQLKRDLAIHKFNYVTEVDGQLARLADRVLDSGRFFSLARNDLEEAKRNFASGDWLATCLSAQRAMRPLRLIERGHWEKAVASIGSPAASPLLASFGEIPYHWLLARELERLGRSRSLLEQGDLEMDDAAWKAGWRPFKHNQPGVTAMCYFDPAEHYSGAASLHLSVKALDAEYPPLLVETPPLWVTTPAIEAEAGQQFRIHGWVKVPAPIEASLDGLMILDSLGREPLAERIGKTDGWKEFTLYRAAPSSGPWRLTIALTGLGDAWIDGLTIEPLHAPQSIRALSQSERATPMSALKPALQSIPQTSVPGRRHYGPESATLPRDSAVWRPSGPVAKRAGWESLLTDAPWPYFNAAPGRLERRDARESDRGSARP